MSIGANDLMGFAQGLASAGLGSEVECRTVISRAYYAAYHDSTQWHESLPVQGHVLTGKPLGMHALLAEQLVNPDTTLAPDQNLKSRKRGYALRSLHQKRVVADYRLQDGVTAAQAHQAIADARTIIAIA